MRYATLDVSTKRDGEEVKFQVEVPQIESPEEGITFAGSAELWLEWCNSHLSTDAGNAARPVVRDGKKEEKLEALVAKAQAAARSYVPRGARAPGVKARAGHFDELMSLYGSGASQEEIEAKLKELAGKFGVS